MTHATIRTSAAMVVGALLLVGNAGRIQAQPPDILRDFRFVPLHSNVHVSSGVAGWDANFRVAGTFGFVTGCHVS